MMACSWRMVLATGCRGLGASAFRLNLGLAMVARGHIFVSSDVMTTRHSSSQNEKAPDLSGAFDQVSQQTGSAVGNLLMLHRMAFLQEIRHQERQLDRLVGIKARVAMGVIAVLQFLGGDGAGAASAFGNVLAGHFDMDAAGMCALGAMHLEESLHFLEDAVE